MGYVILQKNTINHNQNVIVQMGYKIQLSELTSSTAGTLSYRSRSKKDLLTENGKIILVI